jgi:fucose 4-O-acetylase-like acetyltransferase
MTALAPALPAARSPKKRVPFWDNARWASITLVVIGHGIQRLTSGSDNALVLYLFIYAFHMPAFAIISGYFSKATPPGRRQMIKLITDILIPYVILQAIWSLVQYLAEGKKGFNPAEPHWTLWFLLALAIFRVALPYLAMLRYPLVWAVIFSVGVGYLSSVDSTFSLSRAIGILPFFLLGWKMRHWRIVDRWRVMRTRVWLIRGAALLVFATWLTLLIVYITPLRKFALQGWFMYDDSYSGLGENQWWAGFLRCGLILLAVILCASFFVLIPRRETWMTAFGQGTMYVYLLHSFILYPLRETGILKGEHSSAMWLLSMVLACISISIALSSPLIRRIFGPLIEPRPRWLFTRPPDGLAAQPALRKPSRIDPTGSRRDRA